MAENQRREMKHSFLSALLLLLTGSGKAALGNALVILCDKNDPAVTEHVNTIFSVSPSFLEHKEQTAPYRISVSFAIKGSLLICCLSAAVLTDL